MIEPKLGDWLQFLGSLIAASTGVALWFAERFRLRKMLLREERRRSREFREIIRIALDDLAAQANAVNVFAETSLSNLNDVAGLIDPASSFDEESIGTILPELCQSAQRLRVQPAPILDASVDHVRYMDSDRSSAIASISAGAKELDRLLNNLVSPTSGGTEAIDTLHMVMQAGTRLLERVDHLIAELRPQPHDHYVQGLAQR